MKKIIFTKECECGEDAIYGVIDLTQEDGDVVKIDLEFQASQITFECPKCGKKYYTGDIEILSEDEM